MNETKVKVEIQNSFVPVSELVKAEWRWSETGCKMYQMPLVCLSYKLLEMIKIDQRIVIVRMRLFLYLLMIGWKEMEKNEAECFFIFLRTKISLWFEIEISKFCKLIVTAFSGNGSAIHGLFGLINKMIFQFWNSDLTFSCKRNLFSFFFSSFFFYF